MSASIRASKETRSTALPKDRIPVPGPPKRPLERPRAAQQIPTASRREHEVRRLIRDLAALAASHRQQISRGASRDDGCL